jgi:dTDP-4-amino-4,6-dideoxygalactose transaminase
MPEFEAYVEEIRSLWGNRWLTHTGPKHQELENKLRTYLGVVNISLFANGHLALELAVDALDLKGEIITTPFTFASTTQAIVRNGLVPVFCDIDEKDYTIDVRKIEALITEKTSAIMPVHVFGNVCDVEAIARIAKKHNLKVIYDAAHSFGESVDGTAIGRYGDISMFSFHATKVFHTVEGGCLTYADSGYTQKLNELRQFGMVGQDSVQAIGTNAKMTEMHAAMGLCNLRIVDEFIAKRKLATERYHELLSGVPGISLCKIPGNIKPNYAYMPALFDKEEFGMGRDEVCEFLAREDIYARKYFYPLTSSFEVYQGMFEIQKTPVAEKIADNILTLPLYSDLSLEDVDRVCRSLLKCRIKRNC